MTLEQRIRESLTAEAEGYEPRPAMWDGVLDRLDRGPARHRGRWVAGLGLLVAAAVAVVLGVAVTDGDDETEVRLRPAAPPTTVPSTIVPPTTVVAGPPAWATTFLATDHEHRRLVHVRAGMQQVVVEAGDVELVPVGLRDNELVYHRTRPRIGERNAFTGELVVQPLDGGAARATFRAFDRGTMSADRNRLAYVAHDGSALTDLVVRNLDNGDEKRFPLRGTRFEDTEPGFTVAPGAAALAGDVVVLTWDNQTWSLDTATATSLDQARRLADSDTATQVIPFDDRSVVSVTYGKTIDLVRRDPRTFAVLETVRVPRLPNSAGPLSDSRGHLFATRTPNPDDRAHPEGGLWALVDNRWVEVASGYDGDFGW